MIRTPMQLTPHQVKALARQTPTALTSPLAMPLTTPQFGNKQPDKSILEKPLKTEGAPKVGLKTLMAFSAFSGVSGFLGGILGGFYNTPSPNPPVQPVQIVQVVTQPNTETSRSGLNTNTLLTSDAPPGRYYRVQDQPLPRNFGLPRNRCGDDGYPPEIPQTSAQVGTQPDASLPDETLKAPPILGADEARKEQEEAFKKQRQEFEKARKEHMQKEYDETLSHQLLFNTTLDPLALSPDHLKLRQEIQGKLKTNALEKSSRRDDLYESLAAYVQPATVQLIAEFKVTSYRVFQPYYSMHSVIEEALPFPQSGTGFFVNSTGLLLTNNHVVELSYLDQDMKQQTRLTDKLHVKLADGKIATAKLVAADKKLDLAMYQLEGEHQNLPYLELASAAKSGTEVMAMGHPMNNQWSASFGKISNTSRAALDRQFIETDTKINPGNSGGPLVDNQGNVVGVNVQIHSTDPGIPGSPIGQAIPYHVVKPFIEPHLKK